MGRADEDCRTLHHLVSSDRDAVFPRHRRSAASVSPEEKPDIPSIASGATLHLGLCRAEGPRLGYRFRLPVIGIVLLSGRARGRPSGDRREVATDRFRRREKRRRTRSFHLQSCSIRKNIILNYKSHGDRRWRLRRRGERAGVAHIDRADPETEGPIPSPRAAFGSGFRPVSRRDHPARTTSEIISRLHVSRPATSTPWTRSRLDNRSCHDKKNTILHNRTIRDGRPVKSKRSRMRHRRKAHRDRPVRTLGVDRARGTNPRGGSEE